MSSTTSKEKQFSDSITIGGEKIEVWPDNLEVTRICEDPTILQTNFSDTEKYHDNLIARILELEKDKEYTHRFEIGGSKVSAMHTWGIPEADLVVARATAFFCKATGRSDAVITGSWGNISRKNEYLSAHSHDNCLASVVYMLEPGDINPDNRLDGRFAIIDPRVPECCDREPERVTMEVSPEMQRGSLLFFPSQIVHHVHLYTGTSPRITLAWNFHLQELM